MTDPVPWRVKGVDPDIRDDAMHAAHAAGMTLGQWLSGVIRDSLADLEAARRVRPSPAQPEGVPPAAPVPGAYPGAFMAYPSQSQQEMASRTMPPFPAHPQPYPPPYAQPQGYAPYPPAPPPYYPPAYDPVDARLRHYARGTETAIPGMGGEERVLSVIDAAVGAMERSVRSSEEKTAAAIEALTGMMQRGQGGAAPAPQHNGAAAPQGGMNDALQALMARFSALEESIAKRGQNGGGQQGRGEDENARAQRVESRLEDALNALNDESGERPLGQRPSAPRTSRPRVNVVRGGAAVAEIAARQRMLDQADPRGIGASETMALDAIRRSIAALSDQVREVSAAPHGDALRQHDVDVRAELKDLQKSVQDLAPRRIVASVNESIRALAQKIEASRQNGAAPVQLAPIEKQLADIRAAVDEAREPRGLKKVAETVERLSQRVEEIGARGFDINTHDDLHRQIGEVRTLVEQAQRQQPVAQLEQQIAQLSRKLDAAVDRSRDGKVVSLVADAVDDLRRRVESANPEKYLSRIDERFNGIQSLEARLEELAARLDRPAPVAQQAGTGFEEIAARLERRMAGIDGLAPKLDRLAERIEARAAAPAPTPDFDDLTSRIAAMTQSLAGRAAAPDLTPIVERIESIHQAIERQASQKPAPAAAPDMRGLEMVLKRLAERIEAVRAPEASHEAMDALQRQIMLLAEKLDRPVAGVSGLDGLERSIRDLVGQVGSLKDVAASAAIEAVRETAMPGDVGMDSLAAEGMLLIKRDLTEMKNAQAEIESRSRETLQSLGSTLDKIVGRLSSLESGIASVQAAPKAAPQPAPSPVAEAPVRAAPAVTQTVLAIDPQDQPRPAARPAETSRATAQTMVIPGNAPAKTSAPMPSSAPDIDLDLPLEPGAGRNGAAAPAFEEPLGTDPRSNFIAAARRAAQAASAQSKDALADQDGKKGGKGAKLAGDAAGAVNKVKDILAQRRKPLLLGLAALVFSLGGLVVVSNLMSSDDGRLETTGSITPKTVAPVGKDSQLQRRLEEGLSQVERRKSEMPVAQVARAPEAPAERSAEPKAVPAPDTTAVGSIGAGPDKPVTTAPLAAPLPPATDLATLVRSMPASSPDRLKQAAANGNLSAIYEVGARLAEGRGVARDVKAAAMWLEYAANQNFAPAQYRYGSFHREGIGMPQNPKLAFTWFQRAAEQGHILAMHNLAVLHAEGVTGSPDYASAAAWFRTAAEHGVKDSQFNIAILYVRGLGVAHDMTEAYKWFAAAAAQGDPDATKKRDEVAARLPKDKLVEAKELADAFRARRPDARANDVAAPEGGWDKDTRGVKVEKKKTRV